MVGKLFCRILCLLQVVTASLVVLAYPNQQRHSTPKHYGAPKQRHAQMTLPTPASLQKSYVRQQRVVEQKFREQQRALQRAAEQRMKERQRVEEQQLRQRRVAERRLEQQQRVMRRAEQKRQQEMRRAAVQKIKESNVAVGQQIFRDARRIPSSTTTSQPTSSSLGATNAPAKKKKGILSTLVDVFFILGGIGLIVGLFCGGGSAHIHSQGASCDTGLRGSTRASTRDGAYTSIDDTTSSGPIVHTTFYDDEDREYTGVGENPQDLVRPTPGDYGEFTHVNDGSSTGYYVNPRTGETQKWDQWGKHVETDEYGNPK